MVDWRRLLPLAWSLVLALLMLGPALGPGYTLSYDMVWVPDLALRPDFLGLGTGVPRAVPSDAVVAVLDELVPGMLLQKLVLVAVLAAAGVGAARLTERSSMVAGLVALTFYEWNPFVTERLLIGHWPVLVGYAALPWIVLGAQRWRSSDRLPTPLLFLVPLGSLSAGAGVVTAVALLAFAADRRTRRLASLAALLLAANAPWIVAGMLHASSALTDPAGARAFALHAEGSVPAPLAALGLGGIWNSEVVLPSRTGVTGWIWLAVLAVLVAVGFERWYRRTPRRDVTGFAICWLLGLGTAVLSWALPDQMGWVVSHVPGGGLLRDGSRLLALCAPALVAVIGHAAARLVTGWASEAGPAIALVLVLVPVVLMPDAAFGLGGRLGSVLYPEDYQRAREAVARATRPDAPDDVLLLPFSSYRQPGWNDDRKVLDPTGRYLEPDFVADDDLYVSGRQIAGEDPRARAAGRALRAGSPGERSERLARLGIGFVVTEAGAGPAPRVRGATVFAGPELSVQALASPRSRPVAGTWIAAMTCAWSLFLGCFGLGTLRLVRRLAGRFASG